MSIQVFLSILVVPRPILFFNKLFYFNLIYTRVQQNSWGGGVRNIIEIFHGSHIDTWIKVYNQFISGIKQGHDKYMNASACIFSYNLFKI